MYSIQTYIAIKIHGFFRDFATDCTRHWEKLFAYRIILKMTSFSSNKNSSIHWIYFHIRVHMRLKMKFSRSWNKNVAWNFIFYSLIELLKIRSYKLVCYSLFRRYIVLISLIYSPNVFIYLLFGIVSSRQNDNSILAVWQQYITTDWHQLHPHYVAGEPADVTWKHIGGRNRANLPSAILWQRHWRQKSRRFIVV